MVRDLSKFALQLHGKPGSTPAQMDYCLKLIRKPAVDEARYARVWSQVHTLRDEYEMDP
jgi:acyl-CoA dehydrogenase